MVDFTGPAGTLTSRLCEILIGKDLDCFGPAEETAEAIEVVLDALRSGQELPLMQMLAKNRRTAKAALAVLATGKAAILEHAATLEAKSS